MQDKRLAVRKRLRDDFEFYAKHCLKIIPKDSITSPLLFNTAQRELNSIIEGQLKTTGKVRIIILKARQMGLSTYVGGRLFFKVSQNYNRTAFVATHKAEATDSLFKMTHNYYRECPPEVQPKTKYSSKKELTFSILNSGYGVATAGGSDFGRSMRITDLHISEFAFWSNSTARENFAGLMQAVPSTSDTQVIIESTANGIGNAFHEQWVAACDGRSEFIPVFLPWFIEPGYRATPSEDFTPTPVEQSLIEKYGLDFEQLMFRRLKIAEIGNDTFMQEYPSNSEEAFLTSGRPVFDPVCVAELMAKARARYSKVSVNGGWEPLERRALQTNEKGKWEWLPHSRGELLIYHPLDISETYTIGVDIAMGVQGDFSVAQVLDSKKRQVAVYRGQIIPEAFADTLWYLGRYYNEAFIIAEANSFGRSTCVKLYKELNYSNFYVERQLDKTLDQQTERLGFTTTPKTKPLIVANLQFEIRNSNIELNDYQTLRELQTYVVKETGGYGAEYGCYDDCVMSLAMANHEHQKAWKPIENKKEWLFHYDS